VRPEPFVKELLESFTEPLQLLLLLVAVLSAVFGELSDAIAIFVVIVAVVVTETVTETRAAHAIAALKQLSAPVARVHRDQQTRELPAAEVVPGDVLVRRPETSCRPMPESSNPPDCWSTSRA
jgi:P-type Ca2+ transporter type 2C